MDSVAHGTLVMVLVAIGIAGVGFATFAVPLIAGTQHATSVGTSSSAAVTTLTATPTAVANNPYDCPKVETVGNLTWTSNPCARPLLGGDFASGAQANSTLDSPQVQAFIKNAYEYHVVYFKQKMGGNLSSASSNAQAILNVTGTQTVSGNWSTGYQVSYVGNSILNVTIAQVAPSSYQVSHLSVYKLPDRHTSLSFTAQQQRVIGAAASDPKADNLMAGGPVLRRVRLALDEQHRVCRTAVPRLQRK